MRKGILSLFLSLFLVTSIQAQQAPKDDKFTLQEAIDIALENSYQLKVAKNNVALSEKQIRSEKADYLPSVSANVGGNRDVGRRFNTDIGAITSQTSNSVFSSISADVPIFSGLENLHSLKSTRYDKKSNEENLERVRQDIIFNTANNYLQFILDKKILEIDRENLAASKKTLEQVKAQVKVGSRPKVDLYNQQSTVASNELAVVNSRNAVQSSRLALIQTMQISPRKDYSFVSPEIDTQSVSAKNYNLDKLVETAVQNRSDLQSEQYNIQSLKHQLSSAQGALYPSLSLSGSFSSRYNDQSINQVTGQPLSFSDQFFDRNISRGFGLSINIPIFNNLSRRLNVQSQRISYKNAKLNLQDTRLQVVQEVNQAFNDYQSYEQELQSAQKALQAAERSYKSQKQRYEVGAGTLVELSDANAQYVEAQSNRAQALFRLIFQQKLLDYYIGQINDDMTLQ